jgi:hypothetical protein
MWRYSDEKPLHPIILKLIKKLYVNRDKGVDFGPTDKATSAIQGALGATGT